MDTAILFFGILPWFWKVTIHSMCSLMLLRFAEIYRKVGFLLWFCRNLASWQCTWVWMQRMK